MNNRREQMHTDLKAVLAASRDLSAEYDDVLADLVLDEILLARPDGIPRRSATLTLWEVPRAGWMPITIALATGTFLSLVAALMAGASVGHFLLLWVFTTLVMVAVVQIGLAANRGTRGLFSH